MGDDEPGELEVGAPLGQVVEAERRGGERYAPLSDTKTFTIFRDNNIVARGTFEHG